MVNIFRKWFGGEAARVAVAEAPAAIPVEGTAADDASSPPWTARDVELTFHRLALGVAPSDDEQLSGPEQTALKHLRDAFSSDRFDPRSLPRLPALVPQLLRSLKSDEIGSNELAQQISGDPVLVGEIVRVCNSAMYRGNRPIDSLQQGVMMLGQDGLRRVVMQLVMRPILQVDNGRLGQAAGQALWSHAERCAQATMLLGKGEVDPFQAYLAGTVCNTGAIALIRLLDQRAYLEDAAHSARFIEAYAQLARRVTVTIAQHWEFPAPVVAALTERAGHEGRNVSPLGRALRLADRLAMLDMLTDRGLAESDAVLVEADAGDVPMPKLLSVREALQRTFATEHSEIN